MGLCTYLNRVGSGEGVELSTHTNLCHPERSAAEARDLRFTPPCTNAEGHVLMRLFAGIPLSAQLTSDLAAISLRLQAKDDGLRWSPAESWHITLQFLGTTPASQYACLVARLKELRSLEVPVQPGALGAFERAGVFFAGIDLTPGLASLQQRVNEQTSLCGMAPETRPYHPHITLARSKAKGAARIRAMHALLGKTQRLQKLSSFTAREFLLYESVAAPGGSLYQVRERFPLEPAA